MQSLSKDAKRPTAAQRQFWSERFIGSDDADDRQLIATSRACLARSRAVLARTEKAVADVKPSAGAGPES